MPQLPKSKKQRFEAGERFQVPRLENEVLRLTEDRNREYIAHYQQNRWCFLCFIDVVTETHLYVHLPGSDPVAIAFETFTFPEP
ncbi:hypothetical protein [Dyadobacter aurulentus]|uniref:hypothetical protein n=1 Tax=Dyadobacter sp. UC 10 TaxID=2605428 RepID=UPI0011F35F3A|nr:hypothetical protein [Dyadobacter sp. UC 10]KAA0992753.1 hypothetical protein FXO21_22540 [Dyadobacter sp. UC 10]